MLQNIIRFSLKNRLVVALLVLAMIGFGIYNFIKLPIDAVPDITNNQVQVITVSPSLAPQEIEQFITFPVEMAMSNIQDVTEIRSISRFGLSVVTVVFKDKVDIYLARQLVGEQIKMAEGNIAEGYGKPEMMPVTTGLGEIYQYVLEPKKGYEDKYDALELRTIQDWIVKRHLSGIPGIVEVSSFGGYLKQFVVAVNPRNLVGMDITINEIYEAITNNNQNTGGSYIEKGPNSYYVRAEGLVENIEDIENIVIKTINNVPILIKDVAQVKIGAPPRFGAMTKDGKGEAVGGITLMLKGANSNEAIKNVKDRIERVKEILPEGVELVPYLDRSKLISKTTNTVKNNLLEGGLIVIFILILLLGSYRSGLIVASVIPLSMLFAFIMMNIFGVTANLMSLGAIDFGLIVDGAVIMVEGIMYTLHKNHNGKRLSQSEMNKAIDLASSKVASSAGFGVLIILIVYLPILVFTGIEGKMFKPMAQTVSFALLGALILSVTYVPMISSFFLSKKIESKKTFADRIIDFLNKSHAPVLDLALRFKYWVISIVVIVFFISLWLFLRLGGEFIPSLEEGDLAAQMAITPGSSLSQSIETSTKAEKILLDNFPEVVSVVSKIGTAEVPTDPMAVEDADIMIILKDKKDWVSASSSEELSDLMKDKLAVLPGVSFEFTQPIQLRFNELMTGVKSDVAVKIYGEDLDSLFKVANIAAAYINNINGAGDVKVEQIVGLPQLVVKYKRDKIAQFGLNINDINKTIRTAFAGEKAGVVFEGEKRFDLVIRLDKDYRADLNSLQRLRINKPDGDLILLEQVADVVMENGPMQISRDDAKRRITIGINVRNRDIESFIGEVDDVLKQNLRLPVGYYITYGGEFENLQDAKRSSSIAVPIALVLIFILLYFAFHSINQAVIIFTAIPLAIVGGVWALYFRNMPFSISAGVGFIALFGIVVLNGIVLISYYNQLEKEGVSDIYERVKLGTRMRLRPVLLTASTDALGFFPMAVSTAPGAEVQQPLATVVIGGLVTSTFLTLVVLPVIYVVFKEGFKLKKSKVIASLLLFAFMLPTVSQAQEVQQYSLDDAIKVAIERNKTIQAASLNVSSYQQLTKSAFNLPQPELTYEMGQINSSMQDYHFSVNQTIDFPTIYALRKSMYKLETERAEVELSLTRELIKAQVKNKYHQNLLVKKKLELYKKLDSLYKDMNKGIELKYKLGEISSTERALLNSYLIDIKNNIGISKSEYCKINRELATFLGLTCEIQLRDDFKLEELHFLNDTSGKNSSLQQQLIAQKNQIAENAFKLEKSANLPAFSVGYFTQSIDKQTGFTGFQFGVSLPIWFWSYSGKNQFAKIQAEKTRTQNENTLLEIENSIQSLLIQIEQKLGIVNTYKHFLNHFKEMQQALDKAYDSGESNLVDYVLALKESIRLELDYYQALYELNSLITEYQFLTSK